MFAIFFFSFSFGSRFFGGQVLYAFSSMGAKDRYFSIPDPIFFMATLSLSPPVIRNWHIHLPIILYHLWKTKEYELSNIVAYTCTYTRLKVFAHFLEVLTRMDGLHRGEGMGKGVMWV